MSHQLAKSVRLSRLKLVGVACVFVLPFLGALILYLNIDNQSLWATSNHGDLIVPAKSLTDFTLMLEDQGELGLEGIKGKWTLVYFSPGECGERCKKNIYHMRQVRTGLGKDIHRVERILVLNDAGQEIRMFLESYPEMLVADAWAQKVDSFSSQFPQENYPGENRVYLLDPLGNLIMSFPPELDPRGMLKDLKKLLKISRIG